MGSEMKIEIPTTLIEDSIRCEMVRQIGNENKEKLLESVISHAMTGKKDSYSSTQTYFQEAVNEMIRDEAIKIFKEWLEANRQDISKALFTHLNGNKQKRLKEFCENLTSNIKSYGIRVNLDLTER